jgi:hypothetical protein
MSYEATLLKTIKDRACSSEPVSAVVQIFILDENKYVSDDEQQRVHNQLRSRVISMMTPLQVNDRRIMFVPIGNKYLYTQDTHMNGVRTMYLNGFEAHLNKPENKSKLVEAQYAQNTSVHFLHFKPLVYDPAVDNEKLNRITIV